MKESKTFDESLDDLKKAWHQLKFELGKMFGLDKLVVWMGKFFS